MRWQIEKKSILLNNFLIVNKNVENPTKKKRGGSQILQLLLLNIFQYS